MRRILGPVLAAHYLAAFTALGMPLFLPQVLAELAPSAAVGWSGVLYVLPTLCTALTASSWGVGRTAMDANVRCCAHNWAWRWALRLPASRRR